MRHHTVEQLRTVAAVHNESKSPMSERDRLQRWAELLEANPQRRLNSLRGTEWFRPDERNAMRADGSAISVALADPVLRAGGLRGDTYGEAKRFFGLTDRQMHDILCYCQYGDTTSANAAARAIHRVLGAPGREGWLSRLTGWLSRPAL